MITEAGIKAAIRKAPDAGQTVAELRDGGARGEGRLVMLVRPMKGRVSSDWYAVWYRNGRRSMTKMGTWPTMSLLDARRIFRDDYAPKIAVGESPAGPRARVDRRGITVRDLFDFYLERLEGMGSPSLAKVKAMLLAAGKAIGEDIRAADVRPADITPHLSGIYQRGAPAMAREVRAYIGAAFNLAIRSTNDYRQMGRSAEWGITANPVAAIPADPDAVKPGERHLSPAQFRAFWRWLEGQDERSGVAPAFRAIMATGQRITEILRVSAAALDPVENLIDWSKTKNGKPHTLPLPPQAVAIFAALTPNRHGLFFPSATDPEQPSTLSATDHLLARYFEETSAEPFTARDLRRTWKTLTGAAGIGKEVRDRLQNHARGDVASKHYDRWDYMPEKRAAMATWSAYLDRILSGALDNPVAQLRG